MGHEEELPHKKHRPYRRAKAKSTVMAAIALAHDSTDEPFDPAIPAVDVGGGDPGVAELIARTAHLADLMRV